MRNALYGHINSQVKAGASVTLEGDYVLYSEYDNELDDSLMLSSISDGLTRQQAETLLSAAKVEFEKRGYQVEKYSH